MYSASMAPAAARQPAVRLAKKKIHARMNALIKAAFQFHRRTRDSIDLVASCQRAVCNVIEVSGGVFLTVSWHAFQSGNGVKSIW